MQFRSSFAALAIVCLSAMPIVRAEEGDVFTATRVFHTIVRQSPFLVDRTTTTVWTQSASIEPKATVAVIPNNIASPANN